MSTAAAVARFLSIARLIIVGGIAVILLAYRPPGYIPILVAALGAFVVLPFTLNAVLRSRIRKRKHA